MDKSLQEKRVATLRSMLRCGSVLNSMGGRFNGRNRILIFLLVEGRTGQKRLTENMGKSASTLSDQLWKLEEEGLIRRERSRTDRRNYDIILTPAGEAEARRVEPEGEDLANLVMESFTAEELDRLSEYLARMIRAASAPDGAGKGT